MQMIVFFYFKGFHWRKLSLHLHDVFLPLCSSEKIRKSLSSLFDMVTEIHIFNYIHWNRESKYFEILRLRYCLLLFMYAYQLRDVFDETQIENLDTVYIHKIFSHSLAVFKYVNLAGCSCEGGEGMISIIKHLFRFRNKSIDFSFRTVLLRLLFSECIKFNSPFEPIHKSEVFTKDYINQYTPKPIKVHLLGSDTISIFHSFLNFCNFDSLFIDTHLKTLSRRRSNGTVPVKNIVFKNGMDAKVMKKQLAQTRTEFTNLNDSIAEQMDETFDYNFPSNQYLVNVFIYTNLFYEDKPETEEIYKQTNPSFTRENIFRVNNPSMSTDEKKEEERINKLSLKVNNLLNSMDFLDSICEHLEIIVTHLESDKNLNIPDSYQRGGDEDGGLAEYLGFIRKEKWKDEFYASSERVKLRKMFSFDLFTAFQEKYKRCMEILADAHSFYSTINQRIADYNTLEFYIEDKSIADKLIYHCGRFLIVNRKFEIEFKRSAGYFYSIFFHLYNNPNYFEHLPDVEFLKNIFKDFNARLLEFSKAKELDLTRDYDSDFEEETVFISSEDESEGEFDYDQMDLEVDGEREHLRTSQRASARFRSQIEFISSKSDFDKALQPFSRAKNLLSKERFDLYKQLADIPLSKNGFLIFEETDDGHCGYRCIANQIFLLTGKEITHLQVRKSALERFIDHSAANYLENSIMSEDDVQNIIENNMEVLERGNVATNCWIDYYMFVEVSQIQKMNINVIDAYKAAVTTIEYDGDDCIGSCFIISWQNHFDSLLFNQEYYYERINRLIYNKRSSTHSSL